jgi:hypothetical protein
MVIDAEFGREDYGSIPVTAIGRGLELTDTRTKFNWWQKPIYSTTTIKITLYTPTFVFLRKSGLHLLVSVHFCTERNYTWTPSETFSPLLFAV